MSLNESRDNGLGDNTDTDNKQLDDRNDDGEDDKTLETEPLASDRHSKDLKNTIDSEQNDVTLVVPEIKIHKMNGTGKEDKTDGRKNSVTTFKASARASKVYPSFQKKKELDSESIIEESITIWQAVRDNLHQELDFMLMRYPDPIHDKDSAGFTALHLACKYNKILIIQVLLQHKADVEADGPYNSKPLHLAAKYDSIDAVRYLIKHGANVMSKDCKEKSPLHHAVRKGNLDVCKILLDSGRCDINDTDEDGFTTLHEAVIHKQTTVVKLLLERGVDIFAKCISEVTAYQYAVCEELLDVMDSIYKEALRVGGTEAQKSLITQVDSEGNTALHMAVLNNKIKAVEVLLQAGSPVNAKNNTNYTALHIASFNGNVEILKLLLSFGADMELRDKDFMTPVHRAALFNRYQIIDILMTKGGNINAKNKNLMTPLLLACWKGHMETVQFLLTNGCQITETDINMKSVLHWSVETGHLNVLLVLLQRNASNLIDYADNNDQTALHYAAKRGDLTILKALLNNKGTIDARDQDGKTPLHVAAEYNNVVIIDELVRVSQAELNDGDADGRTPLMLAAKTGNYSSVKSLLCHGADVTVRDENSCTALMMASAEGHYKVIKCLIDNLADIQAADKLKNTALHISSQNGHVECVRLLLQRHASVTKKNMYGKTALDLAIDFSRTDVVIAFLKHSTWRESMDVRNKKGQTAMDSLIQKVPEGALAVMDNCVEQSDDRKDDINYTIKYHFKYIDPGVDDPASQNQRYFALNTMIEYNREELLSHPLVQSILIFKWRKFGRVMFYTNLTLYFIYMVFLLIYTSIMPKITTSLLDNVRSCPITLTATELSNQTLVDYYKENGQISNLMVQDPFILALQGILSGLIFIFMFQQLALLLSSRWRFFLDINNYIALAMLMSSVRFLNPYNYLPCEHEWRAGWIGSLLAWMLFMDYIKQFDKIGLFFVMFSEVLISLLKVTFVLILFLMAFSQAFAITMAQTSGFTSSNAYPLTVLAMTLGEISYVDNFETNGNTPFNNDNFFLILVFMIMMPIALMNLLVGVAVGDIDKIQKKAYITRLSLQISRLYGSETRFPKWFQRKWHQQTYEMKPNADKIGLWFKIKKNVFGTKATENTSSFIGAENDDIMKESVDKLRCEITKQKYQLNQMENLIKQQQEMLKQIGEHFHVEYHLDTISVADTLRPDSRMDL